MTKNSANLDREPIVTRRKHQPDELPNFNGYNVPDGDPVKKRGEEQKKGCTCGPECKGKADISKCCRKAFDNAKDEEER